MSSFPMFAFRVALLSVCCLSIPSAYSQEKNPTQFLIVAPTEIEPALRDYASYKSKQLPTELVRLDEILKSSAGADDAEQLKTYLFQRWQHDKIKYVLLAGDADVLPVRFMTLDRIDPKAFNYSFYPSDLYYADVAKDDGSFDDWNAVKEGFHAAYFGEVRGEFNKSDPINYDHVSYVPEIAVGRWPVSTADAARQVAEKTIAYERGVLAGAKPGEHEAAIFATGGWVDMRSQMDQFASTISPQWKVEKHYFADRHRDDHTPPPDEQNVIQALNRGVGLVLHAGHGADDRWEGSFALKSLAQLKNADRLPIVMSAGCSTARFATLPPYEPYRDADGKDHEGSDRGESFKEPPPPPSCYQRGQFNRTGLGEQLLVANSNGAIAYIGCNTGSQPSGLTLMEGLVGSIGNDHCSRLGDAWNGAIRHYYAAERLASIKPTDDWYPPSIFFQGMKFMVYADPTLILPSSDNSK